MVRVRARMEVLRTLQVVLPRLLLGMDLEQVCWAGAMVFGR